MMLDDHSPYHHFWPCSHITKPNDVALFQGNHSKLCMTFGKPRMIFHHCWKKHAKSPQWATFWKHRNMNVSFPGVSYKTYFIENWFRMSRSHSTHRFFAVKLRHQQNVRAAAGALLSWQPRYVQRMGFSALAATWRTWEEHMHPPNATKTAAFPSYVLGPCWRGIHIKRYKNNDWPRTQ